MDAMEKYNELVKVCNFQTKVWSYRCYGIKDVGVEEAIANLNKAEEGLARLGLKEGMVIKTPDPELYPGHYLRIERVPEDATKVNLRSFESGIYVPFEWLKETSNYTIIPDFDWDAWRAAKAEEKQAWREEESRWEYRWD